jgi:ribose transport system ATP-binding protein
VPQLPIPANITLASLRRLCKLGFLRHQQERRWSEEYVEQLDVQTPSLYQRVELLSGGNQQKVGLARWLCSRARIMILDEPTRGIDVGAKVEVFRLINQLTREGVGIIMISSELPEVLAMADRILVMSRGTITAEFLRGEATQEDILKFASIGRVEEDTDDATANTQPEIN